MKIYITFGRLNVKYNCNGKASSLDKKNIQCLE
jgi:hypothetical protein